MKCFIVDDNQLYIDIITHAISSPNDVIKSTTNPHKAIEQIIAFDPDVIVIDFVMPDISGTQLAEQIKNVDQIKHIPIILISSGDIPRDFNRYGIDDYIEKSEPIDTIKKSLDLFSNIGKINKHVKKMR